MAKAPRVKEWVAKQEEDIQAAIAGQTLLIDPNAAVVKYKRKKWSVGELLQHLAERVSKLERKQCKPNAKCIFKGQDYLDEQYTPSLPKRSEFPPERKQQILPDEFPVSY